MNEDSEKLCLNCQRDIPIGNYQMHAVHCQRNIQLCPKCQEPLPRLELAQHNAEFHSKVKCPECFIDLENHQLEEHKKNNCPKRQVQCQYCELELKADSIYDHEDYCGSRTECCDCGKLVMFKFQKMHLESNHRQVKLDEEESDNLSGDNNGPVNNEGTYQNDLLFGNMRRGMDLDYVEDLEDLRYLDLNEARRNAAAHFKVPLRRASVEPNYPQWEENTYIPCEFCQQAIAADKLILHQTGCRPDLASYKKTNSHLNRTVVRNVKQDNTQNEHMDIWNGALRQQDENILIPCEFCQKPFMLDYLSAHQITCQDSMRNPIGNRAPDLY